MPVVNFHLVEGRFTPAQADRLLREASRLYAEVLAAPMERVRAFITTHQPDRFAVGGEPVMADGPHAPFFDFIVLDGRPLAERHRLAAGFTDLLVDIIGVRRELIRGGCRRIQPEDWSIGGTAASELRHAEVSARAAKARDAAEKEST